MKIDQLPNQVKQVQITDFCYGYTVKFRWLLSRATSMIEPSGNLAKLTSFFLVDDSSCARNSLRFFVEKQPGWKVCGEAENGREAVQGAKELHPDLIILDLSMPIMNGLEAARILKLLMPEVLLVMWTMFGVDIVVNEAVAAGFSLVLSKSDGVHELGDEIRKLIARNEADAPKVLARLQ
jgi:DNA-binding NarL/FixJ family response regulator